MYAHVAEHGKGRNEQIDQCPCSYTQGTVNFQSYESGGVYQNNPEINLWDFETVGFARLESGYLNQGSVL